MCIRDRTSGAFSPNLRQALVDHGIELSQQVTVMIEIVDTQWLIRDDQRNERYPVRKESGVLNPVSYTHLRAHETVLDLVCRLLLEKKKTNNTPMIPNTR